MPVNGVSTNQVQQVVTETVNQAEAAAAPVEVQDTAKPKVGDNYGGITKENAATAKGDNNGKWDVNDHTGNSAADSVLDRFASANANNPAALAAVEGAASEIKQNPEKFVNPDGSINKGTLTDLLSQKFASVSDVTIPSPSLVATESVGNKATESVGNKASESVGNKNTVIPTSTSQIYYKSLGDMANMDIGALAFLVMMEASKSAREDLKAIMDNVKAINKEKEGWRTLSSQINKAAASMSGANAEAPADRAGGAWDKTPDTGFIITQRGDNTKMGQFSCNYVNGKQTMAYGAPGPDGKVVAGGYKLEGTAPWGSPPQYYISKADLERGKEEIKNKLDSLSEMGETESLRLQMAMDRLAKLSSTLSNMLKKLSETASGITQNIK